MLPQSRNAPLMDLLAPRLALVLCFGLGCAACGADDGTRESESPGATGGATTTGGAPGSGGEEATGGAPTNGTGGTDTATGGTTGDDDCTPNPSGSLVLQEAEQMVFDERTCLYWMREEAEPLGYDLAVSYCADLERGGFDDWRLPTAGEAASLLTNCAGWPPIEDGYFLGTTDIWTSSPAAGDDKVCGAGLGSKLFYTYGKVGGQEVRCVRGPSTVPDRACEGSMCD